MDIIGLKPKRFQDPISLDVTFRYPLRKHVMELSVITEKHDNVCFKIYFLQTTIAKPR